MSVDIVKAVLARAGKSTAEVAPEGNYGSSGENYWSSMAKEFVDAVHAKDHEGVAQCLRAMSGTDEE